jgi:hypothetical protein
MDETYILEHLKTLASLMYSDSEPFAKHSKRRGVFIFGCIRPFGGTIKNIVHRSVAIYLSIHTIQKDDTTNKNKELPSTQTKRRRVE